MSQSVSQRRSGARVPRMSVRGRLRGAAVACGVVLASAIAATPALADDAPDTTPPSQVTGMSVTSFRDSLRLQLRYTVHWTPATDNVGVTAYDVYIGTPDQPGGILYDTLPGTATESTPKFAGSYVTDPQAVFTVVARDAAGNASTPSAPLTTSTCEGNEPRVPARPINVAATDTTSTGTTISWAPGRPTCNPTSTAGYQVYSTSGTPGPTLLGTASSSATSLKLTGVLAPATAYKLYVVATGDNGALTNQSQSVDVTTLAGANAPDTTPPAQVTGLAATPSPGSPGLWDVSWNPTTDDTGVTGYEIYSRNTRVASVLGNVTSATKVTVYGVNRAEPIIVIARDAAGNRSVPSAPVRVNTCPASPDVQVLTPTAITATKLTDTTATITWDAPDPNECDHAPTTEFGLFTTAHVKLGSAPAGATSMTVTGLSPETQYFVYLHAVGGLLPEPSDDRVSNSPTISFTTAQTPPSTPTPTPTPTPTTTTVDYGITGSATLKNLAKGTLALTGRTSLAFTSTFNPGSPTPVKSFAGDVTLDPTTASLKALGFLPVTATIAFVPTAPLTGSSGDASASATLKTRIKVPSMKLLGVSLGGGANCQASQISTIPLSSPAPFVGTTTFAGTFSISNLTGCGALNGLVSPLTSGGGNALTLKLASAAAPVLQ